MMKKPCPLLLLLLLTPACLFALPPGWTSVDEEIVIKTVPQQMRYDRSRIQVKPGAKIKLTLVNEDELQHNLLICASGDQTWLKVAQLAWALGEKGMEQQYIPKSPLVLHASRLVNPEQSEVLYFTAPEQEGIYPYVCTFPGHAFNMRGDLVVGSATSGLSEVAYKYYEGSWSKLPDFSALTPVSEGVIEEALFDISKRKRGDQFGMVFDGTLTAPSAGGYTFRLDSDDGSRLLVDGKTVVEFDGLHGPGSPKSGRATLTKGPHKIQVQFFEQGSGEELHVSWAGPGVRLQHLTPTQSGGAADGKHHLFVSGKPKVARMRLPASSPRSLAVGLPSGISYCFDTSDCSVRYGWFGGFVDAGPDRGNGTGRGGGEGKLLGERFSSGYLIGQLKIGDAVPTFKFDGYRRGETTVTLLYTMGGIPVRHTIDALPGELGLKHQFVLGALPAAPLHYAVQANEVTATSDAGVFVDGVLTIPPARAKSFSITVLTK
ncbi:MAG: plastocyanin [Kiritimatiellia bacterium]|jgi:plastocyanin